jgi:hypothetical protein
MTKRKAKTDKRGRSPAAESDILKGLMHFPLLAEDRHART